MQQAGNCYDTAYVSVVLTLNTAEVIWPRKPEVSYCTLN